MNKSSRSEQAPPAVGLPVEQRVMPLLPTRRGQARLMTLAGAQIATEERGHWYSPAAVSDMLSASRRPQSLQIKELKGKLRRLEDMLLAAGRMEQAPCFICGYNGAGYFQPQQHRCAARHHKLRERHNDRVQAGPAAGEE